MLSGRRTEESQRPLSVGMPFNHLESICMQSDAFSTNWTEKAKSFRTGLHFQVHVFGPGPG